MLDYTGIKCPVCGAPFGKDDDIVVCPECGAPYHRACYQQEGQCIFQDLHAEGKEWQPPEPPKAPDVSAEIKDQECPVCGTLNGHSALFCNRCGASLLGEPQRYNNSNPAGGSVPPGAGAGPIPGAGGYQARGPFGVQPPFAYDPMGGVSPAELLDEGVTYGDASRLVKQNTNYYMPVFRFVKHTGRNKFNYCAFLFSGAWMLYRKQYKLGGLLTALHFALYLGYLFTALYVSAPALIQVAGVAGLDLSQGFAPSGDQMLVITQLMSQDPSLYLRLSVPLLCLAGILAIRIVVGLRGNRMYLKHCVGNVRLVKEEGRDGDPSMTLDSRGGVNSAAAACVGVCYLLIMNVLPMLI